MGVTWNPCLIYPSDRTGRYQEFEGRISKSVDHRDLGFAHVTIEVEGIGELSGYWPIPDNHRNDSRWVPPVGGTARIHVYDAGGGWYPDNEIMGFSGKV